MLAPELLLEALEELVDRNFEKFQWYLTIKVVDGCKPIPRSRVENICRTETVSVMTDHYGEELAMTITDEILKKMGLNTIRDKLKKTDTEGNSDAASASSSALTPPAAPAAISAQQGSVIIAPTLNSGTTGSWNITIHKP